MQASNEGQVQVWDLFVRIFHWTLVIAVATAYLVEPEDGTLVIHVWAGYTICGLLVLRVIWGFVGPKHARFSSFVYSPFTALAYLKDLVRGRAKRYVGHSPAGSLMVFALLGCLVITVGAGLTTLGAVKHKGPLAPLFASSQTVSMTVPALISTARADEYGEESEHRGREKSPIKEIHEFFANLTIILAFLHVGGVVVASLSHRENLARSMVTGRKRPE
jgi:cytochrome b